MIKNGRFCILFEKLTVRRLNEVAVSSAIKPSLNLAYDDGLYGVRWPPYGTQALRGW